MMERNLTYFVGDTHLGLEVGDPADREKRFVDFLRSIDGAKTEAVYLLGDIFDFWYEYRDVVPKGYARLFAALLDLVDAGVKVYFFEGNHDVWTYHYFEELGMTRLSQPAILTIGGKVFCIGHGDGLGPGRGGYKFLRWIFHNRPLQWLFSFLHPWIAFRIGTNWSKRGVHAQRHEYVFRGEDEPLYKFAAGMSSERHIDYFIFGHFHVKVDEALPSGARLMVLKDWFDSSSCIIFDGEDCRHSD